MLATRTLVPLRGVSARYFSSEVAKSEFKPQIKIAKGPGGHQQIYLVAGHTATVFGCSGFLGRYVVNNLGTQIVLPHRGNIEDIRHLKVMGDLGQLSPLRFDLRDEQSLIECIRHSDIVYNLIGRDYQTKNFTFEKVHVDGSRQLAKLARELGVSKFVHVSALNADVNSSSKFLRTKAFGEEAVREEFPNAIIVRPGHMFGHEDRFWNRMGWFMQWFGGNMPIVNGGRTEMRPVYVGDVAAFLANQVADHKAVGKLVELYGANEYYYASLVELFCDITKRHSRGIYLPKTVAKLLASSMASVQAFPLISSDEVERLAISDKITPDTLNFEDFNIKPVSVEDSIIRFARLFRPAEFARASFDLTKKYRISDLQ
ncbi:39kDa subunit of ndufa9, NADH:ubiquinone oxidoreductase [Nowakowskiella sp. JEL0078]|nr:39kDa subunit of ndufa9, NADH:ubiquinone oxidoreductase [Nowakowskiella sp. JEL0078]